MLAHFINAGLLCFCFISIYFTVKIIIKHVRMLHASLSKKWAHYKYMRKARKSFKQCKIM